MPTTASAGSPSCRPPVPNLARIGRVTLRAGVDRGPCLSVVADCMQTVLRIYLSAGQLAGLLSLRPPPGNGIPRGGFSPTSETQHQHSQPTSRPPTKGGPRRDELLPSPSPTIISHRTPQQRAHVLTFDAFGDRVRRWAALNEPTSLWISVPPMTVGRRQSQQS